MDGRDSTQSLLVLRKLTRAIADAVRISDDRIPRDFARSCGEDGAGRLRRGRFQESSRRSERAFKELQALYESVAATKHSLSRELTLRSDLRSGWRLLRSIPRMIKSGSRPGRSWCVRP
jgi:hypothetical protein